MMVGMQYDAVPVVHVEGLSHIEIWSEGRARFCLYETKRTGAGLHIASAVIDIIMPLSSLPDAIAKAMAVSATELAGKVYRYLPLSMH